MLMWHGVHGERAGDLLKWTKALVKRRSGITCHMRIDLPVMDNLWIILSQHSVSQRGYGVEVRRKDVDLLASLCLHTFSISQHLYVKIPTRGATSRDQELLSQPSLVPASITPSSPSNSPKQYLTTSSITRFHVLRLLCALAVDLHTKRIISSPFPEQLLSPVMTIGHLGSCAGAEEMEASSAASGSIGAQNA